MWVDLKSFNRMPWEMAFDDKKRPCHIYGMRKMNEYHLDKLGQENRRRKSSGGHPGMKWQSVKYRDPDMQRLVDENKGTTSSYNYQ